MEDVLPIDILYHIMDKASPWTAYCMALSCKDLLRHYESGKCPHNKPADIGGCDTITKLFKPKADESHSVSVTLFDDSDTDEDDEQHDDIEGITNHASQGEDEEEESHSVSVTLFDDSDTDEGDEQHDDIEGITNHAEDEEASESDTESEKKFAAQQKQQEEEYFASMNVAGCSKPLGDLRLGAMTICEISGRDFTFVCDNSDGSRSDRQLLLIDDYFKIRKGKQYKSFVCSRSAGLTKFKASFPVSKKYTPCRPCRPASDHWKYDPIPCTSKRMIDKSDWGLFDGDNSEEVHMTPHCHRGYECIGFDVRPVETARTFTLQLVLYDAEHYVS